MTYVKINGTQYPAKIYTRVHDKDWGSRESQTITLGMSYEEAMALFVDDLDWAIVYQADSYIDADGKAVTPDAEVYDNSDYSVAGSVTDNRNGTVTVKMGKPTSDELLAILMGG